MPMLTVDIDLEYDQDVIKEIQESNGDSVNVAEYISEAVNDIIRADIDNIHSRNAKKAVDIIVRHHLESSLGYLLPKPPQKETPAPTGRDVLLDAMREIIGSPAGRALIREVVADTHAGCAGHD